MKKNIFDRIMFVVVTAIILAVFNVGPVHSTIAIDIECQKNDLPPGSCYNGESVYYRDGDTLNFVDVTNWNEIIFFKLVSTANATTIPNEIFVKFPNMVHLNLRIGFHQLTTNTFEKAGKIKSLILKRNYVEILTSGVFTKLHELEEMNLQDNQLSVIEVGAFSGMENLQILNLYGNFLTVLRANIFTGAINLRNLNCGFNAIESIEDGALNLSKLEEILFFNNKIKHLSNTVFAASPKLLNIDLKQNMLETVGQSFFLLNKLHQLQLSGNDHLTDINIIAFATMPSLNYLGLENIGLRTVGTQLSMDQGPTKSPLTTLSLSHNRLSSPEFLSKISIFRKLEKIYVDQNAFTRWDETDVGNIKKMFPHIELVVTKTNAWDKQWITNTLVPSFRSGRIYCDQFKYLGVYIFSEDEQNNGVAQTVEGDECL